MVSPPEETSYRHRPEAPPAVAAPAMYAVERSNIARSRATNSVNEAISLATNGPVATSQSVDLPASVPPAARYVIAKRDSGFDTPPPVTWKNFRVGVCRTM